MAISFQTIKEQPKALSVLFFTEMWERFSFYGMRALLVLYMTKYFGFEDEKAYAIYGAYGSLVYGSPILGGYLADKYLGFKRSILFGAVLMAIGHAIMSISEPFYYFLALSFIALGSGFFKPNISSLVGTLYKDQDSRRDRGFIIFYMGINLGALGQGLFGFLGENIGWHWGFGAAAIGMVIGWLLFYSQSNRFEQGNAPDEAFITQKIFGIPRYLLFMVAATALIPLYAYLLFENSWLKFILLGLLAGLLLYLFYSTTHLDKISREKIYSALVLILFSVFFWALFEQAGSSINLFTDRNVNREVFGNIIPASSFQSVNALFIILLAPLFAFIWMVLSQKQKEPSLPMKFVLALLQIGVGFGVMAAGKFFANDQALVPLVFLVAGYFFHTTGELCLSPVGLSMITKLSPPSMTGLMMGTWFLASSFAHYIGGMLAQLTSIDSGQQANAALSLDVYAQNFSIVGAIAVGFALVLASLSPVLNRWMHGVK